MKNLIHLHVKNVEFYLLFIQGKSGFVLTNLKKYRKKNLDFYKSVLSLPI